MEQQKRVIALGFFDGVHEGHAALLRRAAQLARDGGMVSAGFTFDRHPESVIFGQEQRLLTAPEDRAELMRALCGVDEVIIAPFDRAMMEQNWRDFVTEFLIRQHNAAYLVAGHDFHFGYKGEGNPERLKALCCELGLGCDIIPKVEKDGITVSSTYIRTLVAQGEMRRAAEFLGHPHTLFGTVAHGKGLGHTLGFPTVNLPFPPSVIVPPLGVYATRVRDGSACYTAVTNVGRRPTVESCGTVNVESFLLDFQGDLYGKRIAVEFFDFLRPERKFPSLEALKAEIAQNAEKTRALLAP